MNETHTSALYLTGGAAGEANGHRSITGLHASTCAGQNELVIHAINSLSLCVRGIRTAMISMKSLHRTAAELHYPQVSDLIDNARQDLLLAGQLLDSGSLEALQDFLNNSQQATQD